VRGEPEPPGEQAGQTQAVQVDDGGHAADRRKVAVVAVAERRRGSPGQARTDRLCDVATHLLCGRRDSGNQLAVLRDRRQIAGDKDFLVPGHGQVGQHRHAAAAIERDAERLRDRRCRNAGGPDHGARRHEHVAEPISLGID
jgi:hypothetical protein